jgi:putative polymerase
MTAIVSFDQYDATAATPTAKRLGINAGFADLCASVLMVATVVFNAGLAFVNGHVFGLNNTVVVLVQAALIAGAAGVALLSQPRGIGRWIAFAWLMLVLNVALMLLRSSFDPKPIGDVLVLPVFVALGLCMTPRTLVRTILFLQCLLVVFVLWELFLPTSFGNLFAVREYYVATRGFSESKFWAGTDSLFLSSQRPGGRLLKVGFNINRGSSLFLEPVTLGNWTIVVTVAVVTFWREMSTSTKVALLFTNLLLVIGCDGRLALVTNIALLLTMAVSTRLPRLVPFLYLPVLFVTLATLVSAGIIGVEGGTDSNIGRYANSTMTFMNLKLPELFGIVSTGSVVTADSGWAYICLKQSLIGLIALWVAVTLMVPFGEKGRRFSHSAGIFIALGLPVSFSIVSIKMAATLWMIAGCASREIWNDRGREAGERARGLGKRRLIPAGSKPFLAASLSHKRIGF